MNEFFSSKSFCVGRARSPQRAAVLSWEKGLVRTLRGEETGVGGFIGGNDFAGVDLKGGKGGTTKDTKSTKKDCMGGRLGEPSLPQVTKEGCGGFSLIEIMVTVGLLSFIILGLLSMFTQTQRAFRDSMKQTDVLQSGRIVGGMIARELEQMAPSQVNGTNFFAEIEPEFTPPLLQDLTGSPNQPRTNIVQHFFFITKMGENYEGIGYKVVPEYPNGGVGTLYRYSTNQHKSWVTNLASEFLNAPMGRLARVADGIVHFRVVAYDTNGAPITPIQPAQMKNTYRFWDLNIPNQPEYFMLSNAVPAYVDLEMGVLEQHTLERYRAIGGPVVGQLPAAAAAAREYLSNHIAQVHLFRQRVPIHTVDFTAYQ